ncbi:hypothetical protein HXX76_005663 [Chlamydomonas incerta]|uniref:Uncharacterized protein n=1 Tax=Chlamydomonas incerta TaxID=51695 RepID=A0A835T335_CHLIN|nr:hypothetical protein HXX76_005663 [Chlamydomonas incerta]|eukprot:KAG2438052.1 hypothetical protein HXX76_005663 [Chlamydomonas incerta]
MRVRSGSVSGLPSPFERLPPAALQPPFAASSSGLVPTAAPPSSLRREMSPARQIMRHSISGVTSASGSNRQGLAPYSSYSKEDAFLAAAAAVNAANAAATLPQARPVAPINASPGRPLVPTTRGSSFILPTPAASVPTPTAPPFNVIGGPAPGAMAPPAARVSAYSSPGFAMGYSNGTSGVGAGAGTSQGGGAVPCADPAADLLAVARGGDLEFPGPASAGGGGGGLGSGGSSLILAGTALPVPPQEPSPGLRRPSSFSRTRSMSGFAPSPPASPMRASAPNAPAPPPGNAASPGLRRPAPAGVAHRTSASGAFGSASASAGVGGPAVSFGGSVGSSGPNSPLLRNAPSLRSRLSAVSEGALLAARCSAKATAEHIASLEAEVDAEHSSDDNAGSDADMEDDATLDGLAVRPDIVTPAPSLLPGTTQASMVRRALLGSASSVDMALAAGLSSLRTKSHSSSVRTVSFSPVVLGDGRGPGGTTSSGPRAPACAAGANSSVEAPAAAAPPPLPSAAAARPRSAALNAAAGSSPPVWAWDSAAADGVTVAAASPRAGGGRGCSVTFRGVDSDGSDDDTADAASRQNGRAGGSKPPQQQEGPLDWVLDDDAPTAAAATAEEDVPTAARRRRFMVSASGASFYTQNGGPDGDSDGDDDIIADAATANSLSSDGAEAVAVAPPVLPPSPAGGHLRTSASGHRSFTDATGARAGASNVLASRALSMSALQLSQVAAAAAAAGLGGAAAGGEDGAAMLLVNEDLTDPVLDGIDPGRLEMRRHMQRIRMSLNGASGGPRAAGASRQRLLLSMSGTADTSGAAAPAGHAAAASSVPGANSNISIGGGATAAAAVAASTGTSATGANSGSGAVKSGGEGPPASPPRSALANLVDQALKLPCVGLERLNDPEKRLKVMQKLEAAAAEGPASIAKVLSTTRPGGGRWCR